MASPYDSTTPFGFALGSNTLGPLGAFEFRKFWKESGMPTTQFESTPIDFWYEKLFHGRIDGNGIVVYPSETNFKQVPNEADETYWAFDFVVDAFSDFQSHCGQAITKGLMSDDGPIAKIEPKRAWVSIHDEYNIHMEKIYNHLVTFWFQKERRNSKIKKCVSTGQARADCKSDPLRTHFY